MKKVLLVEDDQYIRDITATRLLDKNYDVLQAASGAQAVSLSSEHKPQIILLDLDLPDMHGLDVLREIRSLPEMSAVPVIVFSNNDAPEIRELLLNAGATAFCNKAKTEFDEILSLVETHTTVQ